MLKPLRVLCFYPWPSFQCTGSWFRFSSLWHFLSQQGAEVTLAFIEQGADARLSGLTVRYFGKNPLIGEQRMMVNFGSEKQASDIRQFSPRECDILVRYVKQAYLREPGLEAWLERVVKEHDAVCCEYPFYLPLLSDFCRKEGKPLIATSHDALFELHSERPLAKEYLKQLEIQSLRLADARVFCNDKERQLFGGFGIGRHNRDQHGRCLGRFTGRG